MRVALSGPGRRFPFLSVVILVCASILYFAGISCLAALWSSSQTPSDWEAAARLEPNNATNWERLGLYREWNLEDRDLAAAEDNIARAVQMDPLSSQLRLELASIEEERAELTKARSAYTIAKADYPISADVSWRYGSFLLRQGDIASGFSELKHALENDSELETTALAECWAADPNADAIVNHVLPRRSEAYLAALDYFISQKQAIAAKTVWNGLLQLRQRFPMERTLSFIDELINEDEVSDAKGVWNQALLATDWPRSAAADGNLIFNGGFEIEILNGGFDWRELHADGVSLTVDNAVAHSGVRSLRIAFANAENINFQHVYELVAVQPNTRYRFTAFLRTEDLTTDSGIQFQVLDPRRPAELQLLTPSLDGTNPWTKVVAEFRTANTDLIEVVLRRLPSESFDNTLRGTVWVDDVALVPIQTRSEGGAK